MSKAIAFTAGLGDLICGRIAAGESLRAICREDDMPSPALVCKWLAEDANASFREQYARAREVQADTIFEEILEIADDATNDWMERNRSDGQSAGWELNGEHVQRCKLRIDARRWMLGKMQPKKYGEKVDLTLGGGDKPVVHTIRLVGVRASSEPS